MIVLSTIFDTLERTPRPTSEALFLQIAALAPQLGFEYCSYGLRNYHTPTQTAVYFYDNFPQGWIKDCAQQRFQDTDPAGSATLQEARLGVHQAQQNGPSHHCGAVYGVARPYWGPAGEFGLLSFDRTSHAVTPTEVQQLDHAMRILASYVHEEMNQLLRPGRIRFCAETLSTRERDILLWTAEGKTAEEVSAILGISVRTVNFHIQNSLEKTGCRNKVQAAVRLVMTF